MTAHRPFRLINAEAIAPYVFICDHASNVVPAALKDLGLPRLELQRHIAWDIGAAGVAEILSARFRAPAVICGTSRLVIDCNRYPENPSAMPVVSDRTRVPGNENLSAAERTDRVARYFTPYHDAIGAIIEQKLAAGQAPAVLSIHSMTPVMGGVARPWQIAMSWHLDQRLSLPMLNALRQVSGVIVGDNQPYALDPAEDYSVPQHAMRRGLPHVQVEFRQDEVDTPRGIAAWARIFGDALLGVLPPSKP
jgi:predicted N-formylglutamate amidohydrolase